jgi:hypothetical protein
MSLPRWLRCDSLSSGKPHAGGEVSGERFGVVVEIDQHGLVEAGLDETVRVPIEGGVEFLAVEEPPEVVDEDLTPRRSWTPRRSRGLTIAPAVGPRD